MPCDSMMSSLGTGGEVDGFMHPLWKRGLYLDMECGFFSRKGTPTKGLDFSLELPNKDLLMAVLHQ